MVKVGDRRLVLRDFEKVLFDKEEITLDKNALQEVENCHQFLKEFASDKVIYGINTGFGPMAQYKIDDDKRIQLQYNLIRSHCSGMGEAFEGTYIQAAMLCQLNTMMLAHSGIDKQVPELISQLINHKICPIVFEHGGVGASGDLVQLAHLALGYIGEGDVLYKGQVQPCAKVMEEHNIKPLEIQMREGLSLMNGTSVMTGVGFVNASLAKNLLGWSITASAMLNEIVCAYDDHLSKELNYAKQHKGQRVIADILRSILGDSQLTENRQEHLYNTEVKETVIKKKVQEYYSLRCLPQILGPIYDALSQTINTLENEANSVNDNPIIDVATQNVYHGGNFHGDYVSLSMDHLRLAVTKMSMLAERQLNFLLNHKINDILPPFVNLGELGFNFGVQGAQFTATSTTAENQMLSNSMYVHSIPNNNDNQDVVSMGTNSSSATRRVIENAYQVIAIEFVAIVQAIEYLQIEDKLSSFTKELYQELKTITPPFVEDTTMYQRNTAVKEYLQNKRLAIFEQPNLSNISLNNANGIKTH
ncbi:HAL/PAL/TAL family ammonia-lyase [Aureispira anguillae]|uniref:Aromatic amino acid ammonia-lyase n=1 Tax=Aureispira anguillae TaxID=2864201 RepID=A0A915YLW7_9BACT|nr:aromatic amino acid ammonia-lyase [Aureispira anguillae]BDS15628.1 aromatic amino acid ammonia-lyase [Aureispira anguillae]